MNLMSRYSSPRAEARRIAEARETARETAERLRRLRREREVERDVQRARMQKARLESERKARYSRFEARTAPHPRSAYAAYLARRVAARAAARIRDRGTPEERRRLDKLRYQRGTAMLQQNRLRQLQQEAREEEQLRQLQRQARLQQMQRRLAPPPPRARGYPRPAPGPGYAPPPPRDPGFDIWGFSTISPMPPHRSPLLDFSGFGAPQAPPRRGLRPQPLPQAVV